MKKLPLALVIYFAFAFLLLLLGLSALSNWQSQNRSQKQLQYLVEQINPAVVQAGALSGQVLRLEMAIQTIANSSEPQQLRDHLANFDQLAADTLEIFANTPEPTVDLRKQKQDLRQSFEQISRTTRSLEALKEQAFTVAANSQTQYQAIQFQRQQAEQFLESLRSEIRFADEAGLSVLAIDSITANINSRNSQLQELYESIYAEATNLEALQGYQTQLERLAAQVQRVYPMLERYSDEYASITSNRGSNLRSLLAYGELTASLPLIEAQQIQAEMAAQLQQALARLAENIRHFERQSQDFIDLANHTAQVSYQQTQQQSRQNLQFTLAIFIFSSLLAIALAWFLARSIVVPVRHLVACMRQLAAGDLRVRMPAVNGKEFQQAAQEMQSLIETQRDLITDIQTSALALSQSSRQILLQSESTSSNMQQQEGQIELLASAMTELDSSANEVHLSIDNSHQLVVDADNSVNATSQQLAATESAIQNLGNIIADASQRFDLVNKESSEIFGVLELISNIADKTNLLALNAAIEAARAGEQGRGFAVVADEVRTLAGQAQKATSSINDMLERLQKSIDQALPLMSASGQQAQTAIEQAAHVVKALADLRHNFEQIKHHSANISESARQQSQVIAEISGNVNQFSQFSKETSAVSIQTQEQALALREQASTQERQIEKFNL